MTALPAISTLTAGSVTEGGAKAYFTAERSYLAGLLGTTGVAADALTSLGSFGAQYGVKTAAYTVVAADRGKFITATGTWTLALTAAATLGAGFSFQIINNGSGVITIDPNSSEQINGTTTLTIPAGYSAMVTCTGSGWLAVTMQVANAAPFATRAAFVTWATGLVLAAGTVVFAEGLGYRYLGSGTAIADLPGWLPVSYLGYSPRQWGWTGVATASDTAKANAAIAWIGANGGGDIVFPPGAYAVANTGVFGANWDDQQCIWVGVNNVRLVGYGCKLTMGDAQNAHVMKLGNRAVSTLSVHNVQVLGFELDQNRDNNSFPGESVDHWSGIEVCSGSTRITVRDMFVHHTIYYGYGFQREGFYNCNFIDCRAENTGADGADFKADLDTERGNIIRNFVCKDFGLYQDSMLTPQAGLDIRSGWIAHGVEIEMTTAITGRVAIRLQDYDADPTVKSTASVTGFRIIGPGKTVANTGIRLATRAATVTDGYIYGFSDAISGSNPDLKLTNVEVLQCAVLARFWQDATAGVECDNILATGITARNCTAGFIFDSVDEASMVNCDVRACTNIGLDIRTGCSNIRYLGGSLTGNGTNLSNLGTGTVLRDVSGYKTGTVYTATVPVDSTGRKTGTIAHLLSEAPTKSQVVLAISQTTVVTDYRFDSLIVTGVDATNVYFAVNITTASATGAATALVSARSTILSTAA